MFAQAKRFYKEVRFELAKVTWPSGDETRKLTLLVGAMAGFMMLFLWLVDLFWNFVVQWLMSL